MAYGDTKRPAEKVPPPDKLGVGGDPLEDAEPMEAGPDDEEAEKALRVSQMEDFATALGLKVTPEQAQSACEALDAYFGK